MVPVKNLRARLGTSWLREITHLTNWSAQSIKTLDYVRVKIPMNFMSEKPESIYAYYAGEFYGEKSS